MDFPAICLRFQPVDDPKADPPQFLLKVQQLFVGGDWGSRAWEGLRGGPSGLLIRSPARTRMTYSPSRPLIGSQFIYQQLDLLEAKFQILQTGLKCSGVYLRVACLVQCTQSRLLLAHVKKKKLGLGWERDHQLCLGFFARAATLVVK